MIEALSRQVMLGTAGADAPELPVVYVVSVPHNDEQIGARVVFTLSGPDGKTTSDTTVTNGGGVAKLEAWHLGNALGSYEAKALVAGATPISFHAEVRGPVTATYDLVSINGNQLPFENVTEGHYVLFADGSYLHAYNRAADDTALSMGLYNQSLPGVIDFYVDPATASPFYVANDYLFATAKLNGTKMSVGYTDTFDFEPEIYVAR
jgi:hypothetical protein